MGTQTLLTAEQFAQLPPDETEDVELVDGELVPMSSANFGHALIKDGLITAFRLYLGSHRIGEVGSEINCELSKSVVRRPDVSFFVTQLGRTIPRKQVPIPFAPDIAIEVLSPSETAIEVNKKVLEYQNAGSQEVWVFDPENSEIFVYTNDGVRVLRNSAKLTSPLLPGFELSVADILGQ